MLSCGKSKLLSQRDTSKAGSYLSKQDIRGKLFVVEQADSEGVAQSHVGESQHLVPDRSYIAPLRLGTQVGHSGLRVHGHLHVAVNGVEALEQVIGRGYVLALYHLSTSDQQSFKGLASFGLSMGCLKLRDYTEEQKG